MYHLSITLQSSFSVQNIYAHMCVLYLEIVFFADTIAQKHGSWHSYDAMFC